MDWLKIVYWVCLALVWVELIVVFWLIRKNKQRLKRLERLEELYETTIRELDVIRDRYLERLYEMRMEVSDEGSDRDNR